MWGIRRGIAQPSLATAKTSLTTNENTNLWIIKIYQKSKYLLLEYTWWYQLQIYILHRRGWPCKGFSPSTFEFSVQSLWQYYQCAHTLWIYKILENVCSCIYIYTFIWQIMLHISPWIWQNFCVHYRKNGMCLRVFSLLGLYIDSDFCGCEIYPLPLNWVSQFKISLKNISSPHRRYCWKCSEYKLMQWCLLEFTDIL